MSTLGLGRALLVVRALHADGGPEAPETWERSPEGDTGWYGLTEPTGVERFLAYRAAVDQAGTRGLFAVFGSPAVLATIEAAAALALPAAEAWRRRADAGVLLYLRSWPVLDCAGFERVDGAVVPFSGVRRVLDSGGRLPDYTVDSLPWNLAPDGSLTTQELARYRITSISGLAMHTSMGGVGCDVLFAAEPDPGA